MSVQLSDGGRPQNEKRYQAGGGEISRFDPHDRLLMGLLRAVADVVVVGSATLRASPSHVWTAEYIRPAFADAFRDLRAALGKLGPPLNVIVTARGELDLRLRVFSSGDVPVLIVTTPHGSRRLHEHHLPEEIRIVAGGVPAGIEPARAPLDKSCPL